MNVECVMAHCDRNVLSAAINIRESCRNLINLLTSTNYVIGSSPSATQPMSWNSKASQSVMNVYYKGRLRFVFVAFERSVRICILQQNHSPVLLCIWWTFQWIVIKVECVGRKYHLIRELVPSFGRAWFWWNQMLCLRWLPLDKCTVPGTGNWVGYT